MLAHFDLLSVLIHLLEVLTDNRELLEFPVEFLLESSR